MRAKHTAGPWHRHELAIHTHHVTGTSVKHYEVATVALHGGLSLDVTECRAIAAANARLITASPKLLEAGKRMLRELSDDGITSETAHMLKDAVAEAEGLIEAESHS